MVAKSHPIPRLIPASAEDKQEQTPVFKVGEVKLTDKNSDASCFGIKNNCSREDENNK